MRGLHCWKPPGSSGSTWCSMRLTGGYEVVGVCREQSAAKLDGFTPGASPSYPGATDDREVIRTAGRGCDGVLTVLVPRGCPRLLDGDRSGGARPGGTGRAAGVLLRLAHLRVTGGTSTRAGSNGRLLSWAGSASSSGRSTSMTRSRPAAACSPATRGGPSCAAASSTKAKARAFRCGAGTWATPSWRATSPGGWTSPCSW